MRNHWEKIHISYLQRTNVQWYPSEDTNRASVSVDLYYPRVRFKQAVGVNAMDTCFIHTNTKVRNCFYCIVYFIVRCMFVLCCEQNCFSLEDYLYIIFTLGQTEKALQTVTVFPSISN